MNQVDVHYSAGCGEKANIPVYYMLETRSEACIQIIRCVVDLPETGMPSWLQTRNFELVTHVRDGVRLVDYNATHDPGLRGWDAEAFRYKVYTEIYFRERGKKTEPFFDC